jgi:hypothetical protein
MMKKVYGAFYLISAVSSAISLSLLMFFLNSCAQELRGAASGTLPQIASSLPSWMLIPTTPEETGRKFVFSVGLQNFKPFLGAGYLMKDSVVALGVSGISFIGLEVEYDSISGDISYMNTPLKSKNTFLGFGGGFGGIFSRDRNYSEEGKTHRFAGINPYLMTHLYTQAEGSPVGFYFNLRIGYYHYASTFLKKLAEERGIPAKDTFNGLFFTPAIGIIARIIGGKAGLVFEINTPLTGALIYEPIIHPYVPSFNFAFVF